jgi:hypothetical protein
MQRRSSITILSAFLLFGCGAKEQSSAAASSNDQANDASPAGTSPLNGKLVAACPAAAPTEGSSCSTLAQLCEYGDDLDSACNTVFNCNPNGTWGGEGGSGPGCPTNLKTCAGGVASGSTCNAGDPQCETGVGLCTCLDQSSGDPRPGDAGPDRYAFNCATPDPKCPAWPNRPRIGSACSEPNLQCDYDPCGPNGFAFQCGSDGFWTDAFSDNCGSG